MSSYTRHAVVGYFRDERSAQAAFDELISNGFLREQVHLSSGNQYATDAATGGAGLTGRAPAEKHSGISGWFKSLFESDDYEADATRYSERTRTGGAILAVDATDETHSHAVDILNSHGATDVDEEGVDSQAGTRNVATDRWTDTEPSVRDIKSTGRDVNLNPQERTGDRTIPVIQEDLQIGKRAVQSGGVRVYSKTVEKPVEEEIRLRQERITVDRRPANRPITAADEAMLRDQTIEVFEMSEEPVIEKRARVVEEVRVGKQSSERTETVRDSVRRTEVKTEPIGAAPGTGVTSDYRTDFEQDFRTRYGTTGGDYRTYAPAYEYGYTMAADPRYQGKSWQEVESNLRSDYGQRYPEGSWDRMKDAVRYGWDKVTGKR